MSSFPNFSHIQGFVQSTLRNRRGNTELVSKLTPFVRLVSGGGAGLQLVSNPDFKLLQATGTTYGTSTTAGAIGTTWGGAPVNPNSGQGYRPSPIVTSLEVDEGAGNLSRKATFSITAFTKEQMEKLAQYFLEPGFSIFIEWGWGASGYSGLQSLDAKSISQFQSAVKTNEKRKKSGGHYDNYLGFITGGSVAMDGDKWTLSVNCTGYTELPTYLLTSETGAQKAGEDGTLVTGKPFGVNYIDTESAGLGDERFMKMYNELPQTRQTKAVKNLRSSLKELKNFINFDEEVTEKINDTTDGSWFGLRDSRLSVDGTTVKFPSGTKIVGEERFIKFDTLMKIIYQIGIKGYKLKDGTIINTEVDYEDTICSAFPNIYSTDASKLFIPNPNTPKFKLSATPPTAGTKVSDLISKGVSNNSIEGVNFPGQSPFTFKPKIGLEIEKKAQRWGYLKDLYVNFEFAKGVLDTKNFYLKDALYQILNGLSSAVNGMWDFQIDQSEVGNTTILKIWEMNCITDASKGTPYTFQMIGADSVFIDASLDLDISGAKMNQVIGSKLGRKVNSDSNRTPKNLFGSQLTDSLAVELQDNNVDDNDDDSTETDADKKNIAEANLNIMLGKARFYPKVTLNADYNISGDLYDMCYMGAFSDSNVFSALKSGHDEIGEANTTPPLMPINFSFKVHGVSGIRRGDMFKVNGIPSIYNNGFFQVLSVKHSIDGMQWVTEVTGGYRNNK